MLRRRPPLSFIIALPAVLVGAARASGADRPHGMEVVADTILRADLDRPAGAARMGLVPDGDAPSTRLGLRRISAPPSSVAPVSAARLPMVEPLADLGLRLRA